MRSQRSTARMLSGWTTRMFAALALAVVLNGCSKGTSTGAAPLPGPLGPATEVVNQISKSVPGLSPQQLSQAIGGVLGYSKAKLPPNEYAKVASAFPASDALVSEGTKLGMPSEMTGLTSLQTTLKNAGVSADQFSQLIPAMTNVVKDKAGPDVASTFAKLFR